MEILDDELLPVTTRARMSDPRMVSPQITVWSSIVRFPVASWHEGRSIATKILDCED
jgi:hypothetical protein